MTDDALPRPGSEPDGAGFGRPYVPSPGVVTAPKPTGPVWLRTAAAQVAHSILGRTTTTKWSTRCGSVIQEVRGGLRHQHGAILRWDLLDHDKVRPCRRCWR